MLPTLPAGEPWRLVAHECEGVLGLVTPDGVEGEGAVVFSWIDDLPYGRRPSLTSAWKPLQMPRQQPVLNREQTLDGFFETFVAEESSDVFTGTVWLVAEGKPAREHEHLCIGSAFSMASMEAWRRSAVRLPTDDPALPWRPRSRMRAVSYSQLVPGNTASIPLVRH